jgi:WS/DGAT/MGAT family acyltransferase
MAASGYELLSTQDSSFVHFEHRATPMHVAAVSIFERAPLTRADGRLDVERIVAHIESTLDEMPHHRERLAWAPITRRPIWVDDEHFNIHYHLRHTALPAPGSDEQLESLIGRVLSQHLDREKPLWETWIVDSLEGDRFALIAKVHHCMVDGVGGMGMIAKQLSTSPEPGVVPKLLEFEPRAQPSALRLVIDEAGRRLGLPVRLLAAAARAARDPVGTLSALGESQRAVAAALSGALLPPAETPFNERIGPHRRVALRTTELARVKALKNRLDGTVNDVVLALVAGAIRSYLAGRSVPLADLDYKACVPVNRRSGTGDVEASNKVSALFVTLPVSESDPLERFRRIREQMLRLKQSHAARGIELLADLADLTGSVALTRFGVELATRLHPYNLIVSTVPGPSGRSTCWARAARAAPAAAALPRQGLGSPRSYDGKLCWGLIGDWELAPDLDQLGRDLDAALAELEAASRLAQPQPRLAAR